MVVWVALDRISNRIQEWLIADEDVVRLEIIKNKAHFMHFFEASHKLDTNLNYCL